jgi:hypothetical protein
MRSLGRVVSREAIDKSSPPAFFRGPSGDSLARERLSKVCSDLPPLFLPIRRLGLLILGRPHMRTGPSGDGGRLSNHRRPPVKTVEHFIGPVGLLPE